MREYKGENEFTIGSRDKVVLIFLFTAFFIFCVASLVVNKQNVYAAMQASLFLVILTFPLAYISLYKKSSILDPIFLFSLSIALYEAPKIPWYLGFVKDIRLYALSSNVYGDVDYTSGSIYYLLYTVLCLLSFCFFSVLCKRINFLNLSELSISSSRMYFIYAALTILITVSFLFFTKDNIFYLLSSRQGNVEAKELKGNIYILTLTCITLQNLFMLVYNRQKSKSRKSILICFFIALSVIGYLTTGARGFFIYCIVSFFIFYTYKKEKINWVLLTTVTISFLMIFTILGILRYIPIDEISYETISQQIEKDDNGQSMGAYQLQLRDELIFDVSDRIEPYYFSTLISPLTSIFPKKMLGELKLPMIDGVLARDIWSLENIGLPVNVTTETYLSFKIFGILLFFPLAFLLELLYVKLVKQYSLPELYIPVMMLSQTFLSSKLFFVIQISILMFVFILFSFNRSLSK